MQSHLSNGLDMARPFPIQPARWEIRDWFSLLLLLIFAVLLRLVFFNGFFGSDDLTYLMRSAQISEGVWTSANYNGALRYGYNIPAGGFIFLFGLSPFSANAWTLFCSLAEITVVYVFAARYLNRETAILAALLLATAPLHIAQGTRIHADAVFALFLTLSFVLFYAAEKNRSRWLFYACGLSLGMIFWIKELGVIVFLAFASYPLIFRKFDMRWLWLIAGGLTMLALHFALMQGIASDPLHAIKTVTGQVQSSFVRSGHGEDSPFYYFKYLFLDIRHTWLLAWLALATLITGILAWKKSRPESTAIYVAWWLIALLVVLSFTPVSFNPLRLAMRQSNYLNLFLAPLALLAGMFLFSLNNHLLKRVLLAVVVMGGIALGAVSQQAYQVFSANSRAAVAFIKQHPGEWIVGSTNNGNIARITAILENDPALAERFGYLERDNASNRLKAPAVGRTPSGYAVFDQETIQWGVGAGNLESPPSCWQKVQSITPSTGGAGFFMLQTAHDLSQYLPDSLRQRLRAALARYMTPKQATVYRVDFDNLWCTTPGAGVVNHK